MYICDFYNNSGETLIAKGYSFKGGNNFLSDAIYLGVIKLLEKI